MRSTVSSSASPPERDTAYCTLLSITLCLEVLKIAWYSHPQALYVRVEDLGASLQITPRLEQLLQRTGDKVLGYGNDEDDDEFDARGDRAIHGG
jgi:hypothetical protein